MANTRNIGGYFSGIRKRLRAAGVSEDVINQACRMGGKKSARKIRLSKSVRNRIQEALVNPQDKCVLCLGRSGRLKVYSITAWENLKSHAARMTLARIKMAAAFAAGKAIAVKETVHA